MSTFCRVPGRCLANRGATELASDTDITQYNWDHRNRLVKVQRRSSYGAAVDWVIRYWYDYQNRLVRKLGDLNGAPDYEHKQNFAYDGNQVVMDFRRTGSGLVQTGDLEWRYLWGPAVDQILAEENVDNGADETVQWTLTDHLNTVRDIAKYDSGSDMTTVVNHLIYDAFGRVTSESNPTIDSLFLFTGRPFDSDTQLQNNLNRWYDARVGRWLSEDPIGFNGGDGNLYRYVGNVPLSVVDPSGAAGLPGIGGTLESCAAFCKRMANAAQAAACAFMCRYMSKHLKSVSCCALVRAVQVSVAWSGPQGKKNTIEAGFAMCQASGCKPDLCLDILATG
ncbi:MAG: hypothetical protein KatS3mg112_0611 [Thermogutta sp.]|nr:MAG: hypothetical protein KatS3mg112_0611 [Thermogutta sp.]